MSKPTIRELMRKYKGAWPRDPRAPSQAKQWRGRPFPFPVDTSYIDSRYIDDNADK